MRYFITFSCYGSHMHGDESGSVDRVHRLFGGPVVESDSERAAKERELMDQAPYLLDADGRTCVLAALRQECSHRGWSLLAAHVRGTHVHLIVEAEVPPEKILGIFKSYASRSLNRLGCDAPDRKRWARHGSTRWLWKDEDVRSAVLYVVEGQGEPMEVFVGEGLM